MNSKENFQNRLFAIMSLLACAAWTAGCTSRNLNLEQAQSEYAVAAGNRQVVDLAPVQMQQAQKYLAKADAVGGNKDEVDHYAYLAKKHVELAHAEAARKSAEEDTARMLKGRDKIIVQARTLESEEARLKAKLAEEKAQLAERRATDSDHRSEIAAQHAQGLAEELEDLKSKQTKWGLQMTVPGALFEVGKASLKPGAMHHLEKLIETLKTNGNREALIEGHTDSTGDEEYNLTLSRNRAQSVADFLEQNGIESSRIKVRGLGESYPVANNSTNAGRLQNRRVDVTLLNEGEKAEGAR